MGIFSAINGKMWIIQRLRHNKIEKKSPIRQRMYY